MTYSETLSFLSILLKSITGLALFLFLFVVVSIWFFQGDILYKPNEVFNARAKVTSPADKGIQNFEDVKMKTSDNVLINGFLLKQETDELTKNADTILFFPPNSGNMGHKLPLAKKLMDEFKCNIFMLSYRGFGLSEGVPSEKGIAEDAVCALSYIRSNPLTCNSKVIVYGLGLGGAVAIDLVSKFQNELSQTLLPTLSLAFMRPFSFVFTEKWDSLSKIKNIISIPILFLSAENDDYIPTSQVKKLFTVASAYSESETQFSVVKNATHTNIILNDQYFEYIFSFWSKFIKPMPSYKPTGVFSTMVPKTTTLYKK
ncbi:Protein bem46 [Smittium culicis]|uniref:Protein bem46 n=1 Tax=Smittium culicis TaxID=133412 RepID=A0A1R1YF03_9FUNG|nr:Protein bem46 [Smittium culicis]